MLNLKRFDKAEWFDLPGANGASLMIRPSSRKAATNMLSSAKRKVKVEGEFVDDFDDGKFALALFKYSLVDFKGIVVESANGEELSKDEQKEVMYEYDVIRDFVSEKASELRKKIEDDLNSDLKNLTTSQDG